jgi:hypothetical protein
MSKKKLFITDPNIDVSAKQTNKVIDRNIRYLLEVTNSGKYSVNFKKLSPSDYVAAIELVRHLIEMNLESLDHVNMDENYKKAFLATVREVDSELLQKMSHHWALKVIGENMEELQPTLKLEYKKPKN